MAEYRKELEGQPREKILKLAQKITDRIGHKVTVEDPEYWGLAAVVTDEMAEIALHMKVRKPMRLSDFVRVTKKEEAYLEKILYEMSYVGLLEYNWENEDHEKQWVLPPFVPGSAEFVNMHPEVIEEHPEVAHFFDQMTRLPLDKVTAKVPLGGAGIGMHVIPVEKAIHAINETKDIEHISHWLKKYDGKYAASPCSCRMSRASMGEGCGDDPQDWCIGVGDMADYLVETKKGHYVTYEEVLEILQRAEDNGFVHQITNIDGENKIFAICNCNVNICNALRTSQLYNTPNMSRSAYVAKVTKQDCVACGACVEHCPAGAVKLGQKLCTTHGDIEYPKIELPDTNRWGKERWSPDYRDKNRINCYDTGTAPCKTACPAHIAVQGYLKLASRGRYKEALALIKKENPFPAVCGRICNRRCEEACTRGKIDQAIAIDEVKKFIAECDLKDEYRYIPKKIIPSNRGEFSEKIAIIGAGPAGLSCAYYLACQGYRPTVFEKNEKPGGMLRYGIPSFKLEKEVIDAEIDIMKALGVDIRCSIEIGKDKTIAQLRNEGYKAFYLATGAQKGRILPLENVQAKGVQSAVDLLGSVQKKPVSLQGACVVVGGGNVAIDASRTALRCGAAPVYMVCLEQAEEMAASSDEIREAKEEGVQIINGWGPVSLEEKEGTVASITFKQCVSVFDDSHRFAPVYNEEVLKTIDCQHVIFSVGQQSDIKEIIDQEKLSTRGPWIDADARTFQTSVSDIFTGGDCFTGPAFAIDAIAQGKQAAESLHRYVKPHASMTIGRNLREYIMLNKDEVVFTDYDHTSRQQPVHKKTTPFKESVLPFTEEQVKKETARCLGCGASIVDTNKCIGCGICTTKCEFDAIHLYRELPEASHMVKTEDKAKTILPYMVKRAVKIAFKKKS